MIANSPATFAKLMHDNRGGVFMAAIGLYPRAGMATLISISLGVLLLAITGLLLIAYLKFIRMNPEIRRARLFLMSKRINRFLLAFTIGFMAISVLVLVSFTGIVLPTTVSTGAAFVWIGALLVGSLDLLLISWPRTQLGKAGATQGGGSAAQGGRNGP